MKKTKREKQRGGKKNKDHLKSRKFKNNNNKIGTLEEPRSELSMALNLFHQALALAGLC